MSTSPLFQRLVIDGVGLLGGSLGLALRERGLAAHVAGLGRHADRLEIARSRGAIDSAHTNPAEALAGADALVSCVPPSLIGERFGQLAPLMPEGLFVTDVGSIKGAIVEAARETLPHHVLFIGSHPMSGGANSGVEFAVAELFEANPCILTPTECTHPGAVKLARALWSGVGSVVCEMSPAEHDRVVAAISHLPHLAATALMQALSTPDQNFELLASVAGQGLRGTTRVAAGDPEMWTQITLENRAALHDQVSRLIEVLQGWQRDLAVEAPNRERIFEAFAQGRQARRRLDTAGD